MARALYIPYFSKGVVRVALRLQDEADDMEDVNQEEDVMSTEKVGALPHPKPLWPVATLGVQTAQAKTFPSGRSAVVRLGCPPRT